MVSGDDAQPPAGAVHASFTDLVLLADQIGVDTGASLSGARSLDITRAYARAFFDQHLLGRSRQVRAFAGAGSSPRFPAPAGNAG